MSFCLLTNNKGVTLVELIVALGITSLVLVFVISGSLFIQKHLRDWKQADLLVEELAFIRQDLSQTIRTGRSVMLRQDSIICTSHAGAETVFHWQEGGLSANDRPLLRVKAQRFL